MMTKLSIPANKIRNFIQSIPVAIATIIAILSGIVISCNYDQTPTYQIVNIEGNIELFNMAKSGFGYILKADSSNSTALLVKKGDMIAFEDFYYYYNDPTITKIHIKQIDNTLWINHKPVSIRFTEKNDNSKLFSSLNDKNLAALRSIQIEKKLNDDELKLVQKIIHINPTIGLSTDFGNPEVKDLIKISNPEFILLNIENEKDLQLLNNQHYTELLFLSFSDSIITATLPKMKGLKHVYLVENKKMNQLNSDFFSENQQIESIHLWEFSAKDYNFLSPLKNLKSVSIMDLKNSFDLTALANQKKLNELSLISETSNLNLINQNELQWLSLSGAIDQTTFNSILEKQTKLKVLELNECDSLKSYSALPSLTKLEALVISNKVADEELLKTLNNLKYLSLSYDALSDSTQIDSIQQSLPNCTIVANDGFCMGSGWLILLFPAVLAFAFIRRKYSLQ